MITKLSTAISHVARFSLILILTSAGAIHAQRNLANANASPEAVALYRYIQDMYGERILSGQMWSNFSGDELVYIQTHTGKQPALRGMDFIHQSQNNAEVQRAIDWWRTGGIPSIMWHWGAPSRGEGYPASQLPIDINRCFQPGTAEHTSFWNELRIKGDLLQRLRDANIPILWRPYHELNGNWFWWGKGGPELFKRLWTTMYNYYVNERGLNNLIWVLCYTGEPNGAWFPGNQYVDIGGADTYTTSTGSQIDMFNRTRNALGGNVMPITYHECGIPPNPDLCFRDGATWSWWMEWHSSHLFNMDRTYLRFLYDHNLIITKDEVPNIMAVYGGGNPTPCTPTTITPYLQINTGTWQQTASASASAGNTVRFGPQPLTGGSWSWTGPNSFSATTREVAITNIQSAQAGTYTARYTNSGGCASTQAFTVTVGGGGTASGIVANGTYRVVARHSSKALDAAGAGTADGTNVLQWTYGGGNNQRWTLTHLGSNVYQITGVGSGKALAVASTSTANATNVDLRTYSGATNHRWTISATTGGFYRLSPVSSSGSALDVSGSSTADGANVQIWTYGGGNNQQWTFQAP